MESSFFDAPLQNFATGYAHDVNNLIAIVLLNAERLAELLTDEEPVESIEQIIQACENATILNQQIQAIGGSQLLRKESIDLVTLIDHNRSRFENLIGNLNWLIIRTDLQEKVPVDPELILIAIDCLLQNAGEATQGSEIWISSERAAAPEEKTVIISVTNDGNIDPEVDITKVFDPYFSTKQNHRGLGLSFAASIVANHGGDMTLVNRDNKTVASMRLPLNNDSFENQREETF